MIAGETVENSRRVLVEFDKKHPQGCLGIPASGQSSQPTPMRGPIQRYCSELLAADCAAYPPRRNDDWHYGPPLALWTTIGIMEPLTPSAIDAIESVALPLGDGQLFRPSAPGTTPGHKFQVVQGPSLGHFTSPRGPSRPCTSPNATSHRGRGRRKTPGQDGIQLPWCISRHAFPMFLTSQIKRRLGLRTLRCISRCAGVCDFDLGDSSCLGQCDWTVASVSRSSRNSRQFSTW